MLAGAVGWVALDKWINRITTLVTFTLLGNLLGPKPFGLVALASVVTSFLSLFVDLGFGKALIQRKILEPEHADASFCISMSISTLFAVVLVSLAAPISSVLGQPALAPILRWLSLSLPLSTIQITPSSLLERTFGYRYLAIRHIVGNVSASVIGIVLALCGAGVWALVGQTLGAAVVGSAVLWRVSQWRPHLRVSLRHVRDLWSFSWTVMAVEIALLINSQADRLIVGAALGPTALGYYAIGTRVMSIAVDIITSVMATVALPGFSRVQHDLARLQNMFLAATRLSAMGSVPLFAAMGALAPLVIPAMFGYRWHSAIAVMQIVSVLGVFLCVAYFDAMVLLSVGRQRWTLGIASGQAAFNIGATMLVVHHGLIAVATAITVRSYFFWPVRWLALKHGIGLSISRYLKQWFAAVASSLPMLLVMIALYHGGKRLGLHARPLLLAEAVLIAVAGVGVYLAALRRFAPERLSEVLELLRPLANRVRFRKRPLATME
jgi:PST family polysaccharide transporter